MFYNTICNKCIKRFLAIKTIKERHSCRFISVVFYGSDEFSLETLKLLHQNTQNDEKSDHKFHINSLHLVLTSKSNIISKFAKQNQIISHEFPHKLPKDYYDIGIVSSFGRLIPESAIKACRLGMINIHGSLLPRWRGAAPINYAVLNNDSITGITIMKIRPKKFDIGDIVLQMPHPIQPRITAQELKTELAPIGAQLLWKCLLDLEYYLNNSKPQPNEGITYAPKFDDSYGLIDWSSMTATDIDRRYRAFVGYIDIFTHWRDGRILKLNDIVDPQLVATLELNRLSKCDKPKPGFMYFHKKRHIFCISCADNTWIAFKTFTLKGHSRVSALQFNNGFVNKQKEVILGQNF